MTVKRRVKTTIPLKASEPFLTTILRLIVQLIQYMFGLFFNSRGVITAT